MSQYVFGELKQNLLLLHGYGETPLVWKSLGIDLLRHSAIDLSQMFSANRQLSFADIASIVSGRCLYEPLTIVAQSMGGYCALELMALIPDRISRVVFISSHPFADDASRKKLREREIALIAKGHASLLAGQFTISDSEKIKALRLEMWNSWSREALINALTAMTLRRDNTGILLDTSIKTDFIVGTKDSGIDLSRLSSISMVNKNVVLHKIEDAGHWLIYEKPELLARIAGGCINQ